VASGGPSPATRSRIVASAATAALLAATAIGAAAATAHAPLDHPRQIRLQSAGVSVRGSLGSFCWSTREGAGSCADAADPLHVSGRLPIRPLGRVTLIVFDHARWVQASLLRVEGSAIRRLGRPLRARRAGHDPHKWRVRLPVRLRDVNRLDVFVRSRWGDAEYWAGLSAPWAAADAELRRPRRDDG
jgi:hypothetical protein